MPDDQIESILASLRKLEPCTAEEICEDTGWNQHVVDVSIGLLLEAGLIARAGRKELAPGWDYDAYKLAVREEQTPP